MIESMPIWKWDDWIPKNSNLQPGFDAWRSQKLDEAEAFFSKRYEEGSGEVARGLGSVLWTAGRFELALDAFSEAIRREPRNAMHWSNLGLILRDLKQFSSSLAAFKVALGIDPLYEPALNEKANVLYDLGQYSDALPFYLKALSINNSRAVVHHNLGMCYCALCNYSAARNSFEIALKFDSHYSYSRVMLERLS